MVAAQVQYNKTTYYIIGDFWQIVDRLKAHGARFRFRARRWRWPHSRSALEAAMQPFAVLDISFSQAQALQLEYDRVTIAPTQEWLRSHARLARLSVEWWEAARLKDRQDRKSLKAFETHRERVELALQVVDRPAEILEREQIVALQQTRRMVEKYESRLVKWLGERVKAQRREQVLARFEADMGLTKDNLVEVEAGHGAARLALYDEIAGLEWLPHEITELKAAARVLLKERRQSYKTS